ncbi:MAG: aminoacyl-tRNA hydrolase [Holosporales bacterium]|nr:aminoacyl-tRNA hydrolase [Holosporales bacterium]
MLIVGLGNHGQSFTNTRHNAGFLFVDELAAMLHVISWKEKFHGLLAGAHHHILGDVILLKPQTYMNSSGISVAQCAQFFKKTAAEIIVIHDELDLPVGKIKVKYGGSHRGHNGVRSVSSSLGFDNYKRIMIGIDRPSGSGTDVRDYVLSTFSASEFEVLYSSFGISIENIGSLILGGG